MEQLWNEFWEIFRHGFDAISNPIVGVLIALIGGLMARSFVSVFIISVLAVALDVVAVAVTPMILHGSKVAFPPMDKAFLSFAGTLYIAFFFVILVIYGVKRIFASVRG
jgi:hypothetical protein